ncbi:DUF1501 domain-containing protein [Mesobacterium sp. TK19101]|uniref:DUF1501 domain-containing protein n=1 Tax=Mesobacterium hydrothermale TaxID=3111907 RepID=A0ABU6HMJ9_9RHOB|nr:DUF1501 domain-containing protein [Mesobacterium sp. TK19101]MEC3862415.1 DUF1501 domain-containing protein [Mesobacterium sp. TK19101]
MTQPDLTRRGFLARSALIGCSLAASPLLTPVSFAATPWDNRLVVIILRGGMDGLDVIQPVGDPAFAALSQSGRARKPLPLDGYFALHPALAPLVPLWTAGELQAVHAVSTPYRNKRSHFDGQDLLEAGTVDLAAGTGRDGWLNRLLQTVPGAEAETAYAIGTDNGMILSGDAPVSRWTPESDLTLSPQAVRLARRVMQDDPRFAAALDQAFLLADSDGDPLAVTGGQREMMSEMMQDMKAARTGSAAQRVADFTAGRLRADSRIAAFSITGWDTHDNQQAGIGRALAELSRTILALRDGLGPVWAKTTVLTMTEFGRTARVNGTGGTDHGTGGAMLLAGGALNRARVVSRWPGVDEAALFDRRDLMPTRDIRAHAGWVMRGLFGLERSVLENSIFPGLELGDDPGHLA